MQHPADHSYWHLILQLLKHVSLRRRFQIVVLFALMLAVSVAELFSIGAVLPFLGVLTAPESVFKQSMAQPLIHALNITEPKQLLTFLTFIFGVAAVVSGGLRLLLSWTQIRLSYALGADFSAEIYKRTLYQPYAVHLNRNTSEIIAGVTQKAEDIVHQTLLPSLIIISSVVMMTTVLVALMTLEPTVTAAAILSFGSIYAVVIAVIKKRLSIDGDLINRQQSRVIKALQEALGGIRDVLIDGTQSLYCQIYRDADWRLRKAQSNIAFVAVSPRYIVEALGMALIAAMAYMLAIQPGGLGTAIPVIGMLALAAQRMLPLLQQAFASWSNIRGGKSVLNDVVDFLNQPLPADADKPEPMSLPFHHSISFDSVGFQYGKNLPWVLHGLNLTIPKRSRIGFIGTTGSGKSTMLDIVMGLLNANHGRLKIDDVEITAFNCRAWQKHIAHVPQSIFLADASIAENIAFGIPADQIDWDSVRLAAEKAQMADTIESWQEKYRTLVGERGVRLSGGQRQRIGIARALYKNADVIVFDEATSALDGETEHAVMESIKNLSDDLTVLIVAHRLTTLRDCTQVVELSSGRV
ncbi:MAG: ABC transporter ATP-binding protein/permease, partial [Burkholderiales bacterium]|nr:ABC transporter ATP-binding protein/permease [Burkholderiales bacterium]